MPAYEVIFKTLIQQLDDEGKVAQAAGLLETEIDMVELLKELGVLANPAQEEFIARTPSSIQAAILAAVRDNLRRGADRKQMLFTWTAGYDWELRLNESTSTDISAGGITIHVKSRYPGDAHPGTGI
ncbi:MAG TPA: hypothetical protein VFR41_05915 [Acidimicrobiia bacterium]|nr:hypothetical protein [Acidimicrobiia bacterium]